MLSPAETEKALRVLFKKLRSPARAICHFPKPPQRHEDCGFSIYYKGALVREYYGKALLKEFKIYVEVAQKPKAKLKEVRVEAVRAGFKQCYIDKDFQTIVTVGDKIPQNLLTEDEILLQFYDIAINHV